MKKKLIILVSLIFMVSLSYGQKVVEGKEKKEKGQIMVKAKGALNGQVPTIYVNGVKYPSGILDIIDQKVIEEINVYNGAKAKEKFNDDAVIEIITKKVEKVVIGYPIDKQVTKLDNKTIRMQIDNLSKQDILVVIDGKVCKKEDFKALGYDQIESITVLKDKSAVSIWGKRAENGAIVIETKKKK